VGMATPLLNRARLHGIVLKPFDPASTADENLNRINDLITTKTRAIAVAHITCTTGLVLPAKEISQLGQDKGLFTFFDGAHAPGSVLLDIKDFDCDFYAACGHKWLLAPLGTGFMFVKKDLLDELQTYHVGGHAITDGNWELSQKRQEFTDYVDSAHRYDYGTQNPSLPIGMAAAVDFFNTIGVEKATKRGNELAAYLQKSLIELGDKIEMLTPTEKKSRASIITFKIKNMDYQDVGKIASKNNFTIRLVWEAEVKGIRISTHLYNNQEEVDQFVSMIKSILM
jgi:cysteine desulfurase/selenocysteine lyase